MRIISGEARGRTLFALAGARTRPTSDKLRGSLFNILGARVVGAEVLDLFGGTGALALEALSRGAARAVIADKDRAAVEVIRRNAANVLGDELEQRVRILRADYRSALSAVSDRCFDLVFLDPPYRMAEAYADAIARLARAGMLAREALIICERSRDVRLTLPEGFEVCDPRIYGDTAVDFVRKCETPMKKGMETEE